MYRLVGSYFDAGAGGGVIWKRDISMDSLFSSIQVDPSDRRRICLCGERGSLMVMHLLDLEKDRLSLLA